MKEAKESLDHTCASSTRPRPVSEQVEDGIAELQKNFEETMKKKEELKENATCALPD